MRKLSICVTALITLALVFPTADFGAARGNGFEDSSQSNAARTSLSLEGGYVEDLAIASNGTVYAALNSPNGIFSSTDGGANWAGPGGNADLGTIADVEVDPASNAYIVAGIKLYKSANAGTTWTELTAGRGDYAQALLYAQGKLLAPSRNGSVDISADGGSTFTNAAIEAGSSIVSLAASPTSGTFFALAGSGSAKTLYRSTDGGATWSSTGKAGDFNVIGVDPLDANHLVLDGAAPEYTLNGGGAWSSAGSPGSSGNVNFSGARLYIGMAWTINNGSTWHNMENEATSFTSVLKGGALAIDAADSNTMYINSGRGVAKTTDGGAVWADVYSGMYGVVAYDISQAANKDIVWVAGHGGLAKTTNFTASTPTWTFPITPTTSADYATAVWVNPSNPDIVLTGALGSLYKSADGGSTWTNSGVSIGSGNNISDFLSPGGGNTIYAAYGTKVSGGGTGGGVLKSTDGGATWTDLEMPNVSANALAFSPEDVLFVGVGSENNSAAAARGIYRYRGGRWTHLSEARGELVNDIDTAGANMYAAAGETNSGGIFKSTDNGDTWLQLEGGLPRDGWFKAVAHETGAASTVYASTGRPAGTSYIYKSMNGGETWGLFYTGLVDEAFNDLLFDGLVGGSGTGLYSYKSKARLRAAAISGRNGQLKATLKDGATRKALKNRRVKLYRVVRARLRYRGTATTNRQGIASFTISSSGSARYQARWTPTSRRDRRSYSQSRSRTIRVR